MNRIYFLKHSPIDFYFRQNSENFKVTENSLYDFSGDGEHLVVKIRKKDLTTWQMVESVAKYLGIKVRDIGYAGLKDKSAFTIQYISINREYEEKFSTFTHPNIKVISTTYHNNKIKRGHLKSNSFYIKLKKVTTLNAQKIVEALKIIDTEGMPNFYGYQRFGKNGTNYKLGLDILNGKNRERNRTKREFLINSYQSYLFNSWLNSRLELSHMLDSFNYDDISKNLKIGRDDILPNQKQFFKLLSGDICSFYGSKSLFVINSEDVSRFIDREITVTGLLYGSKVKQAESGGAKVYEEMFIDSALESVYGSRRDAWVYVKDLEYNYNKEQQWFEINVTLPRGTYATVLLEELYKKDMVNE